MDWIQQWQSKLNKQNGVAPLVRTGGSRHTGLAALPYRNIQWSNVLYERVYPGGDLLIQFVGRDAYKQFWNFSKDEKENLATQLAIELPALRGKVGASQEEIASAVGISRQTYSAYENRTRPIPWSLYLGKR